MANASYPDDDGSRTASGPHDEGRKRPNSNHNVWCPETVAEHSLGTRLNGRTDSAGDQRVSYRGLIDGHASAGTAAYPPRPEDPNARD